jgi:hypothetical protein
MGVAKAAACVRNRVRWPVYNFATVVAAAVILNASTETAHAEGTTVVPAQTGSADSANQAFQKKIESLEQRIKLLEAQNKQQSTTASTVPPSKAADNTGLVKPQTKSGKHDNSSTAATEPTPVQAQSKTGSVDIASTPDKTTDAKAAQQTEDKPILGVMESPVAGVVHRFLRRSLFWRSAKSCSRRPVAEWIRRPPSGAVADLRHYRQHHF